MSRQRSKPAPPEAPSTRAAPATPHAAAPHSLPIGAALQASEPLATLLRRLADSRAHFAAVLPLLPEALRDDIRPGSATDQVWTLVAAHNAAAAKLRQLLPSLLQRLQESGWQGTAIKVKVQPRGPVGPLGPSSQR